MNIIRPKSVTALTSKLNISSEASWFTEFVISASMSLIARAIMSRLLDDRNMMIKIEMVPNMPRIRKKQYTVDSMYVNDVGKLNLLSLNDEVVLLMLIYGGSILE